LIFGNKVVGLSRFYRGLWRFFEGDSVGGAQGVIAAFFFFFLKRRFQKNY